MHKISAKKTAFFFNNPQIAEKFVIFNSKVKKFITKDLTLEIVATFRYRLISKIDYKNGT